MRRRPSPRPRLALTAVILALGLGLVATTGPAYAGKRTVLDAERDVIKQVDGQATKPATAFRAADVTRFVTIFRRNTLTLSTTVAEMPANYWAMQWEIHTDVGAVYDVDLLKTGEVRFVLSSNDVPLVCDTMTRSVNPAKGKVTVRIPAACLGEPASVRTGAAAAASSRDLAKIYTDDAQLTGAYVASSLRLGRTVKRG